MITRDEPWAYVLGMRNHYLLLDFDTFNFNYFNSKDELLSHAVITIKKLYLVRKDPFIAWSIFIDSAAGMRIQLGYTFSILISYLVDHIPLLKPLGNKIDERNIALKKMLLEKYAIKTWDMGLPKVRGLYYVDNEYAIINLNLKQRKSAEDKLVYILKLNKFYDSILMGIPHKHQDTQVKDYLSFTVYYAESLMLYGDQMEKIKAKKNEISRITFVDDTIINQIYYTLIHYRKNPKDELRIILKKDQDRLRKFLREGTTPNNTKIFFRGDAKTLTYCFNELYKNKLINRVENPEVDLSQKELASIIYNNFKVRGDLYNACVELNEKSVYDYLRKEEQSRPLNPIFIIKRNEDENRFFDYLLYKSELRKRGQTYKPNNLQPYDTKIIEQIVGFYDYDEHLERESINRKYWEDKTSINSVRLVDNFIGKYLKPISEYESMYHKNRIGIKTHYTEPLNISFNPRKKSIIVNIKLKKSNDIDDLIKILELETLPYISRLQHYRFVVKDKNIDLNDKFFKELIKESFEMYE